MTYCCGILVHEGLVMIADTRTNAGLDNISIFRKLHLFTEPGERIMAIASAGNLSITQSVLSILREGLENPDTGERETLMNAPTMFQAAQRIGRAIRSVHQEEDSALEAADVKFDVSFLFGGQIKGERPRLYMIYSAGNFIECTTDTPYLQIGEHKYGKPVLDRAIILQHGPLGRAQGRPRVGRLHHALEPERGHADRHAGGAARRVRGGAHLPHRAGRALFHRSARALVGGAARRPCQHSAGALQEPTLKNGRAGRTP